MQNGEKRFPISVGEFGSRAEVHGQRRGRIMAIPDSRPEETREILDSIFINPQDWETAAVYNPSSGETYRNGNVAYMLDLMHFLNARMRQIRGATSR